MSAFLDLMAASLRFIIKLPFYIVVLVFYLPITVYEILRDFLEEDEDIVNLILFLWGIAALIGGLILYYHK